MGVPDTKPFPIRIVTAVVAVIVGALLWALVALAVVSWAHRPLVEPSELTPQQQFERPAPPGAPDPRGLPW